MAVIIKNNSNLLAGIILLATSNQALWASEAAELHRSQCIACHAKMTGGDGGVLYKRNDSIIKNKSELKQRVIHCAYGAHTDWSDTEIMAVANYLNQLIYQFP